jgi:hypothetical protein
MDTIVFIDAKKYWSLTHLVCDEIEEDLWWFSSSDELDAMFFGLREFTDPKTVSENPHLKSFKVINPKKYIWAKLKYNI